MHKKAQWSNGPICSLVPPFKSTSDFLITKKKYCTSVTFYIVYIQLTENDAMRHPMRNAAVEVFKLYYYKFLYLFQFQKDYKSNLL